MAHRHPTALFPLHVLVVLTLNVFDETGTLARKTRMCERLWRLFPDHWLGPSLVSVLKVRASRLLVLVVDIGAGLGVFAVFAHDANPKTGVGFHHRSRSHAKCFDLSCFSCLGLGC